jgi:hypothetical protein
LFQPSQPHPEPWIAAVLALNCSLNLSREPKSASICLRRVGAEEGLVEDEEEGARFFQKSCGGLVGRDDVEER